MNYKDILIIGIDSFNPTDAEIAAAIKNYRNQALLASDWTQLPDVTLSNQKVEAWKQYRQELRDMLKQNDDPKLIVFPEPPK